MSVNFNLTYDMMRKTLLVRQDGKAVSQFSQFSHCTSRPFWEWHDSVANNCFSEANGPYNVTLTSGLILGSILKSKFTKEKGCQHFSFEQELINSFQRMEVTNELLKCSSVSATTNEIKCYISPKYQCCKKGITDLFGRYGNSYFGGYDSLPITVSVNDNDNLADIAIISEIEEFHRISLSRKNKPQLVILVKEEPLHFVDEINNRFMFFCDTNSVIKLVQTWISEVIFPDYAVTIIEKLKKCSKWCNLDYDTAMQKIEFIYSLNPVLQLDVTGRIEVSSVGKYKFQKFPPTLPCRLYSSNSKVALLGEGGVIKPVGEGSAEVIAEVKGFPQYRTSKKIDIYRYISVQSVALHMNRNDVVVGEQFSVSKKCLPSNAHNISKGFWTVIPSANLKIISESKGVFEARKAGSCKIIYQVGNVKDETSILILDKPSSISFNVKTLSVKMGDNSNKLTTTIKPLGSKGGLVQYKISDTRIIGFDSNNGQIQPKQEGTAVVTAVLLDENGTIIDDCNCTVTVLPPKDIVTPDGALVLLIISLIGSVLLINTDWRYLCTGLGCIGAVWYSIRTKTTHSYILSAVILSVIVGVTIIGGMF